MASVINVMNKALAVAIGGRIWKLQLQRCLSQEELSHEADLMLSQIGRIKQGEINPTAPTLHVLAQALGVELKDLVHAKVKK